MNFDFFHFLFNWIKLTNWMWAVVATECLVEKLQGKFSIRGIMDSDALPSHGVKPT
jgi:hypothetical protein